MDLNQWWSANSQRVLKRVLVAVGVVAALAILGYLIWLGYWQGWTGFNAYVDPKGEYHPAKTLWDWMELLIIPVVLAVGGLLFAQSERRAERQEIEQRAKSEREIADDRNRETALQNYLDKMTELLLEHDLRNSESAQDIARARTLTVLRSLDPVRKGIVLQFLSESDLIQGEKPTVSLERAALSGANLVRAALSGANLSGANLSRAHLIEPDLVEANLSGADLSGAVLMIMADLSGADLSRADLSRASLSGANLSGADLSWTDLRGADLSGANLSEAWLHGAVLVEANLSEAYLSEANLSGVMYNDATFWPDDFTPPPDATKIED